MPDCRILTNLLGPAMFPLPKKVFPHLVKTYWSRKNVMSNDVWERLEMHDWKVRNRLWKQLQSLCGQAFRVLCSIRINIVHICMRLYDSLEYLVRELPSTIIFHPTLSYRKDCCIFSSVCRNKTNTYLPRSLKQLSHQAHFEVRPPIPATVLARQICCLEPQCAYVLVSNMVMRENILR